MVLVDTSVWISLYRREKTEVALRMRDLVASGQAAVCGQVWVEYIGGFRNDLERKSHEKSLRLFAFLGTDREAYELAATLLSKHPRLGPGDAVVAATAMESGAPLFTLDRDFVALKQEGLILF